MKLRIEGFQGENRALHPRLLQPTVGVASRNQKPGRGDLRPWKSPSTVAEVPASRKTIYRMGRDTAADAQYWLSWTTVVHAVRGFDAADTTERTYYSGDSAPKVTDNLALDGSDPQVNPTGPRPLGIPAPTGAMTVTTVTGGVSATTVEYYYVYTYVNDWGWESAPSPVSSLNSRLADDTATLNAFTAVPAGNYQINRLRIYRTQVGESGSAEFFFLREITIATTSTTDDNRALGETLATTTWLPAPGVPQGGAANLSEEVLTFLRPLWNGMLCGITGGAVRFCEPYTPYAWPLGYDAVPPDSKAVGVGVFGQQLLVLTTGRPLLVAGSSPESMDQQPLEILQGCVAPQSIVSMGNGVAWASEDGLCWFGTGGSNIITAGLMTREDWQALVPSTITGRMYEGLYFGSYDDGSGRKGFFIDPVSPTGVYFLDTGYEVSHFDELRDQLYVLDGVYVKKWDAGSALTARFRSKIFYGSPKNLKVAKVVADAYPLTVRVYCDAVLKLTKTVASAAPFKLPSGFKASGWQVEVETTGAVQGVALASSVRELDAP